MTHFQTLTNRLDGGDFAVDQTGYFQLQTWGDLANLAGAGLFVVTVAWAMAPARCCSGRRFR